MSARMIQPTEATGYIAWPLNWSWPHLRHRLKNEGKVGDTLCAPVEDVKGKENSWKWDLLNT